MKEIPTAAEKNDLLHSFLTKIECSKIWKQHESAFGRISNGSDELSAQLDEFPSLAVPGHRCGTTGALAFTSTTPLVANNDFFATFLLIYS